MTSFDREPGRVRDRGEILAVVVDVEHDNLTGRGTLRFRPCTIVDEAGDRGRDRIPGR